MVFHFKFQSSNSSHVISNLMILKICRVGMQAMVTPAPSLASFGHKQLSLNLKTFRLTEKSTCIPKLCFFHSHLLQ